MAHLRAAVDGASKEEGSVVSGRKAVADKLELAEQMLYQILEAKSGKKYPTAKTMALFEKKFGAAKPQGWSSQPLKVPPEAPAQAPAPDQRRGLRVVSESQWEFIVDFEMLPDDEKNLLRARLSERANEARRVADETFFRPHKIPPPATNEKVSETISPAPKEKRK